MRASVGAGGRGRVPGQAARSLLSLHTAWVLWEVRAGVDPPCSL